MYGACAPPLWRLAKTKLGNHLQVPSGSTIWHSINPQLLMEDLTPFWPVALDMKMGRRTGHTSGRPVCVLYLQFPISKGHPITHWMPTWLRGVGQSGPIDHWPWRSITPILDWRFGGPDLFYVLIHVVRGRSAWWGLWNLVKLGVLMHNQQQQSKYTFYIRGVAQVVRICVLTWLPQRQSANLEEYGSLTHVKPFLTAVHFTKSLWALNPCVWKYFQFNFLW